MPKKQSDDLSRKGEPKQKTDKGLTIPVPERSAFLRDLGKAAPKPRESEKEQRRTRREE